MTSVRPQWCGATIGLRERISGTTRTYAGVAAGQDWSKGSAELSIRARALSSIDPSVRAYVCFAS